MRLLTTMHLLTVAAMFSIPVTACKCKRHGGGFEDMLTKDCCEKDPPGGTVYVEPLDAGGFSLDCNWSSIKFDTSAFKYCCIKAGADAEC
jgi:hypothetical protein